MNVINLYEKEGFEKDNYNKSYSWALKKVAANFGAQKLGFNIEILEPKTFSCPYHYHTGEEELILVLEGEGTVRCNGEYRRVKPGDLVFYGTGEKSAHNMYNHTEQPFKFFVLSSKDPNECCYYPDSNKKLDRQQKLVTQNGEKAEYFKDEENPAQYWDQKMAIDTMTVEKEVQDVVDRETKAWSERSTDLLLSVFHPDMVWVWPTDRNNFDPMSWSLPQGKFDHDRYLKIYTDWFSKFEIVRTVRTTKKLTVSKQGDGAFAVVDIDTLWRSQSGEESHWFGRTGKTYVKTTAGWKMINQVGVFNF